jgi:hypothetical protein
MRNLIKQLIIAVTTTSCLLAGSEPTFADETQTQTRMRDYSDGAIWQTSTKWGRVRHRPGFEWTLSEPYQVRAVDQFQVDWPTGCTVGGDVSTNSSVSVSGCTPKLAMKVAELDFRSISVPVHWTGPDGQGSKTCEFDKTGSEWTDFHETWTCTGDWMTQQDNYRYSMSTDSVTVDVADDGDGLRSLPGSQDTLTFVQR